jgi:hypothetical protein
MPTSVVRVAAAVAFAFTLTWLPNSIAYACSCGFLGYEEAIATADFAFVGTVVGEEEPLQIVTGFDPARYAFEVSASKRPMNSPFVVETAFGAGGANCGFDMSVGEDWLVVGEVLEGRPQTNLCYGTAQFASLDPAARRAAEVALTVAAPTARPTDAASASAEGAPAQPVDVLPVLAIGGVAIVLAVAGYAAFRRERVS